MKILGILGSGRVGGNSQVLLEEALAGAHEDGAETELINISRMDIKPCDGCGACRKTSTCHIDDDMQAVYGKVLDAQGILFSTPVYFWSMTGQTKVVMDRLSALRYPKLKLAGKVGSVITVAGRNGFMSTISTFYLFFAANHMLAADYVTGFAFDEKGAVRRDKFAMHSARDLGHEVVALANTGFVYPEKFSQVLYRYTTTQHGVTLCPNPDIPPGQRGSEQSRD